MCKFNFRYVLAILTFGIGVLGVYLWFAKIPSPYSSINEVVAEPKRTFSDNRPEIEVSSQPDSPIKITLDDNSEWTVLYDYQGKKTFSFRVPSIQLNVSNKTIRAFSIRQNRGEEFPVNSASTLMNAEDSSQLFQPYQAQNSREGGMFTEPNIPQKITIEVDFVEFADGSTWGKDIGKNKEGLAEEREGAKVYIEYLQKVKKEKGIQAVVKTVNQPITEALKIENALIPSQNQYSSWKSSFSIGMHVVKNRVKKAFETNGIKAVEEELQKPFDLSNTN